MSASRGSRCFALPLGIVVLLVSSLLGVVPAFAGPAAPTGLVPSGDTLSGPPVLEWKRVRGASTYTVEISRSSGFGSLLWKSTTSNRRATPTVQLPSGRIWWRVRGSGSSGTGAWATTSFSRGALAGPTITAPASGTELTQPSRPALLAWTPVNTARSYTIEISTDPNFVDPARIKTYTTKTASFVVPNPQSATVYHWRVRATVGDGVFTDWSEVRNYRIAGLSKPTLVAPADSAMTTVQDVVLQWAPVPGAKAYDIQISTDIHFLSKIDHARGGVKSTRYSPPTTLDNDQYYWRVRPIDVQGNALDWNAVDIWTFRRAWPHQPVLEHPMDGSVVGNPFYYQWTPVKHASVYTVQLSKTNVFNTVDIVGKCTTVHTTYVPRTGDCWPAAEGTYYWRVVARDDPGSVVTDAISAPVNRFTYSPSTVTQTWPADGATVQVPTLRWAPVSGAAKYRVTITPVDGGSDIVATTAALSYTPRSLLAVGKSYRWEVRTISEGGRIGSGLLMGSRPVFTVEAQTPPTSATPEPTGPAAGTSSVRFPTLTWEPVVDATSYKLYLRPKGTSGFTATDKFVYPAGEILGSGWLAPGDYEWKVEAYKGSVFLSDNTTLGEFRISGLADVGGHRAGLTGQSLASPATSCSIALPEQCEDLRQTPVLGWDPQPSAGSYKVWVSRDKELTNVLPGFPVTVESNYWMSRTALFDSQAGSAFFWHVQPCTTAGACAPLKHAGHAFSKKSNPVELQTPVPSAVLANDVTFTWRDYLATNLDASGGKTDATGVNPRIEARQYRVQVALDPSFASVLETAVVDQTTFTSFANTYPEGPVYWRVQAIDGSGNPLTWSPGRLFRKSSPGPTLQSPVNGAAIAGTQPLVWRPLNFAASYDVEVYKDDDRIGSLANRVFSGNSNQVAFSPSSPLPVSATPYRWRVRRVDANGRKGAWTPLDDARATFSVVGAAPALLGPAAGRYVSPKDALFTWKAVDGATSYRFERRAVGSATLAENVSTTSLAWAPTKVIGDGTWEWRVGSLDANGRTMASSPWRRYKVDTVRPTVTRKAPTGKVDRGTNFVVKFSEPVRNVGSGTIKLFMKGRSLPLSAKVTLSSTRRKATINPARNLRSGKVYVIQVREGIRDRAGNRLVKTSWKVTAR